MRTIGFLMLGLGTLLVGCGSSDRVPERPAPNPTPVEFCAAAHMENDVTICDALFEEAPFVHLPASDETHAYAAIRDTSFVTPEGTTYPYPANMMGNDPEMHRHALAIYELTLEGGHVKSFKPAIMFDESVFVAPFMGQAFEGKISSRDSNGQYSMHGTLPVRVEILNEVVSPAGEGFIYEAKAVITNLDKAVKASDGTCMPALSSNGAQAPFAAGAVVTLGAGRSPSMHNFGDDEFVFSVTVNGVANGTMMNNTWYRGPIDIIDGTLAPAGTYTGFGHGSPGSIVALDITPVTGGGGDCTP